MNKASELWTISGHQPCEWTLPVFYQNATGEFSDVTFACYLTSPERAALETVLELHGHKIAGEQWRISNLWMRKYGTGPLAGDPETHKVWGKIKKTKLEIKRDISPREPDWADFLDTLAERSDYSRAELEVQWATFCQHALNRMLIDRKPVDMGFIKLHPMPYRMNWKCVLLSRFKNLGKILSATSDARRQALMVESGLTEEMLCLDLLAYNHKDGYCHVIVEVEHRLQWWRKVKQCESARLLKQKAKGYAASFLNFVRQQLPVTQRLYVLFLAQISRVSPAVTETQSIGGYEFVANTGNYLRNHAKPPVVSIPAVVSNRLPIHAGSSSARDLLETYGVLPEVPGFRSLDEDVRDQRQDVQKPDDPKT